MKKIGIIGAFGFADLKNTTGGQPVKTRSLYYALCDHYGKDNIIYVETYNWKKNVFKLIFRIISLTHNCTDIIMLPAQNGISIFMPVLLCIKRKSTKLYYDVVGGWLAEKAKKEARTIRQLKKLDGIWVETTSMKNDLHNVGVDNVEVIPNFKNIDILTCSEVTKTIEKPFRLCIFSRVMKEKGISDAIASIMYINTTHADQPLILDIFGPIDDSYKSEFLYLLSKTKDYVNYKGIISPLDSVNTLRNYDALLFPTKFYTEGIPGTIIDAYSAGLPIITSLWLNSADVFLEGITGWGYSFGDVEKLTDLLQRLIENPQEFSSMRKNCIEKAVLFSREVVMNRIIECLENS